MTKSSQIPAFPVPTLSSHQGISMRDWFAASALQGLVAKGVTVDADRVWSDEQKDRLLAQKAYGLADAMMSTSGVED